MTKRIAVVTGGMGGIGQAISTELYQQGFRVIVGYNRAQSAALAWQEKEKAKGYDFEIAHVDVSDFQSCEAMINIIENSMGPIDVLVNNAGITQDVTCSKMTQQEWDKVINIDLNSVFYMSRAVVNGMKNRKFGRIINISSINGQKGQYGQVNYSAAKAGMHGFTKALARELARYHITVNTVSPGYVATDMVMSLSDQVKASILAEIPMGRFGQPEEVARVVAFLADEKTEYVTGANIAINGGHYMN